MRTFILALVAASALAGCAYKSTYRRTNFDSDPKPVAQEKVKIARSADDVISKYTEMGRYSGRAPTVDEVMNEAKWWCGENGADLYILDHDPTVTGSGRVEVDGMCALIDPTTTPDWIKAEEKRKKRAERKKKKEAAAKKQAAAERKAKKQAAQKKKAKQAAKKKKAAEQNQ